MVSDEPIGACGYRECLTFLKSDPDRARQWHEMIAKVGMLRPEGRLLYVCLPASQVISQVSTEDVPLCLRVHSLERLARAFGVPIELLSQTTTEAN